MIENENVHGFDGNLSMFLAAMSYQAYQLFKIGKLFLPRGYQLRRAIRTASGEVFGFIAESIDTIIVAFRGTTTFQNIDSYLNIFQIPFTFVSNGGKTHRGITHIYQSIRNIVMKETKQLSSTKRLLVTGHSLGGSLAALFSLDAAVNTTFKHPILYTFAGLPLGNSDFVSRFNQAVKNSIRIVNVHDSVPSVSNRLTPLLFRKEALANLPVGQEFRLRFQTNSITLNHKIICYFSYLSKINPAFAKEMCTLNPGFCPDTSLC